MEAELHYLFVSPIEAPERSAATVFYRVNGKAIAESLCRLFAKEHGEELEVFQSQPAASFAVEEQVLLDETLGWLHAYNHPDPGIYNLSASRDEMHRAQFAVCATGWEQLLRRRERDGEDAPETAHEGPRADQVRTPPSSDDRRSPELAVLMLLAHTYYELLSCATSVCSGAVDLELNHSYLWTLTNIKNLLKNGNFADFPVAFEPLFPDLYPSTIRDVDWNDLVAPHADGFLSGVQQYVFSKQLPPPEEGTSDWILVQLMQGPAGIAVERARAYKERMQQHVEKVFSAVRVRASPEPSPPREQAEVKNETPRGRTTVFVSYSHKDAKTLDELKTMLAPAIQNHVLDLWDDTRIEAGREWRKEIEAATQAAKVAVLLVSPDFLASAFIANHELPPLLNAAREEGLTIFWLCVSSCLWKETEIALYQAAHDVAVPLDRLTRPERRESLMKICAKLIRRFQNS